MATTHGADGKRFIEWHTGRDVCIYCAARMRVSVSVSVRLFVCVCVCVFTPWTAKRFRLMILTAKTNYLIDMPITRL